MAKGITKFEAEDGDTTYLNVAKLSNIRTHVVSSSLTEYEINSGSVDASDFGITSVLAHVTLQGNAKFLGQY